MKLKVKYLENYDRSWGDLKRAKPDDSGMDLRAAIADDVCLKAGERMVIPNGICVEMESDTTDYEVQIRPRSGLAARNGLIVVNTPGTVDWGYRGELMTILLNTGKDDFVIHAGDRISQMVVCPIVRPDIEEADALSDTERGTGRFSSTGVR